jgi:hypothetical protein
MRQDDIDRIVFYVRTSANATGWMNCGTRTEKFDRLNKNELTEAANLARCFAKECEHRLREIEEGAA